MTSTEMSAPVAEADEPDRPPPIALTLGVDRMWTLQAECRGLDYAAFTPGPYTTPSNEPAVRMAQRVCGNCEVRDRCRADALEQAFPVGVWAGVFIPYTNRGGQRTAALNLLGAAQQAAA